MIEGYMIQHDLPRHPLVARGFPSIGCAPCTTPVAAGEDPRAGRWRGSEKEECGIHFVDGRMVLGEVRARDRHVRARVHVVPDGPGIAERHIRACVHIVADL